MLETTSDMKATIPTSVGVSNRYSLDADGFLSEQTFVSLKVSSDMKATIPTSVGVSNRYSLDADGFLSEQTFVSWEQMFSEVGLDDKPSCALSCLAASTKLSISVIFQELVHF